MGMRSPGVLSWRCAAMPASPRVALRVVHQVVPPERLVAEAQALAEIIASDCFDAYACSKRALLHPVMQRISGECIELDKEALAVITLPSSTRAQTRALGQLKQRRPL